MIRRTKWAQPISAYLLIQKKVKIWLGNCVEIPTKKKLLLVMKANLIEKYIRSGG